MIFGVERFMISH